ncbi:MAG: ATP-binding protein [Gulosibacter sp.]|uniref:ATP-binding protein n=1 Tax=Gulosibacter sp. TaxID=2817531 RepID=UPI003F93CB65
MRSSLPSRVDVAMEVGLSLLFLGLAVLPIYRSIQEPAGHSIPVPVLCGLLVLGYFAGQRWAFGLRVSAGALRYFWLAGLTVLWAVLVMLIPEGAYLVFPLFFLYLRALGAVVGTIAVLLTTGIAIAALSYHNGFSLAVFAGPCVGAAVAIAIGLSIRALHREVQKREEVLRELRAALDQLDAAEREAGVMQERARLAREIHDTVAQGLASIQMLLHAADQADPDRPGVEHIRLARDTAAQNLAETRRFIRELTPPNLDADGLLAALERLAESQWRPQGLAVKVRGDEGEGLPMPVQTALLRIAQGAVANVLQHAHAQTVTLTVLRVENAVTFSVKDDGVGFDAESVSEAAAESESFGLRAIQERVEQLGGTLHVRSSADTGTSITVRLTLEEPHDSSRHRR